MRAGATAVQNVIHSGNACGRKRFLADAAITDNMMQLQRKENNEKEDTSRTGKVDGRKEGQEVQVVRYAVR